MCVQVVVLFLAICSSIVFDLVHERRSLATFHEIKRDIDCEEIQISNSNMKRNSIDFQGNLGQSLLASLQTTRSAPYPSKGFKLPLSFTSSLA
jgi:hypothetical protein